MKINQNYFYFQANTRYSIYDDYQVNTNTLKFAKYKNQSLYAIQAAIKAIEARGEPKPRLNREAPFTLNITEKEIDKLAEKAAILKINKAKQGYYKRELNPDFPRTIEIGANGDMYVHFNRSSIGDPVIDLGAHKILKYTANLTQNRIQARATPRKISDTGTEIHQEAEMEVVKDADFHDDYLKGLKGIVPYNHRNTFLSKDKKDSTEIIMPLCDNNLNAAHSEDEKDKIEKVQSLLTTLDQAQENSIVLGDIKPENILLKGKKALFSDYDNAAISGEKNDFPGTFGFIAPERAETGIATKASDDYAMGVTIGEFFFDKGYKLEKLTPATPIAKLAKQVCEGMTQPEPNDRLTTKQALNLINKQIF